SEQREFQDVVEIELAPDVDQIIDRMIAAIGVGGQICDIDRADRGSGKCIEQRRAIVTTQDIDDAGDDADLVCTTYAPGGEHERGSSRSWWHVERSGRDPSDNLPPAARPTSDRRQKRRVS